MMATSWGVLRSRDILLAVCLSSLAVQFATAEYLVINSVVEVFSPLGPRQSEIPSNLGEIFSYNNDIRVGGKAGATVGVMNGICGVSEEITDGVDETQFECTETLVFRSGEYAGSSLTIAGYYAFTLNNPLAIVGGTGRFVGAQGDLNYLPDESFEFATPVMRILTPDAFGASPAPTTSAPMTSAPTTPAPSTAPPATTCDPGGANPNQCFNANGSSFVCCAGGCGASGATATCA